MKSVMAINKGYSKVPTTVFIVISHPKKIKQKINSIKDAMAINKDGLTPKISSTITDNPVVPPHTMLLGW